MYEENAQFAPPVDRNAKIWRYMTFKRYKSMLDSGSLYFCTGAKLQKKEPYEGSCLAWEVLSTTSCEVAREFVRKMRVSGPPITINCWHLSDFESMAMWRLYGDEVAVQSTFDRLVNSLARCPCDVKIGQVKYIMPDEEFFSGDSPFTIFVPYLHKHRGFEYEHELRAIVWETGDMPRQPDGDILIPVDLRTLIEAIYVSPRVLSGVRKDVEDATRASGLDAPVLQSELMTLPMY